MGGSLKNIFLVPDDPAFLEREIQPESVLLNFDLTNVDEIAAAYRKRQAEFSTTPMDPTGQRLRLFPGGVTIWSGFPGTGKTTLLRQLACHLMARPQGVFFASLEEDPRDLLVRIAECAIGHEEPSGVDLDWFVFQFGDRLKIWSSVGIAGYQQVLALIRVLAKRGVRHAIIDSLMCLDVDSRDIDAQRRFAAALTATARLSGCHVHLVAHPRKLMSADQELDINDVAGSADLGRLADNVIFVRRAKNEPMHHDDAKQVMVSVRKQRHGTGATGDIGGWFHRRFRQFSTDQFQREPIRYLPDVAYTEARA